MTKEYTKDYSLLRPFDLEAAKRGGALTNGGLQEGEPVWKWVAGPDSLGSICTEIIGQDKFANPCHFEYFKMAPLCWVEGKPVYRGDVLYGTIAGKSEHVADFVPGMCDEIVLYNGDFKGIHVKYLTWQKPKQRREAWINIYPDSDQWEHNAPCRTDYYPYKTKAFADAGATANRVACIRIEWEE